MNIVSSNAPPHTHTKDHKIRSSGLSRWVLDRMKSILLRDRSHKDTKKVVWYGGEHPSEVGRGNKVSLLKSLERLEACWYLILDFQPPEFWENFCYFKLTSLSLLMQIQGTIHDQKILTYWKQKFIAMNWESIF